MTQVAHWLEHKTECGQMAAVGRLDGKFDLFAYNCAVSEVVRLDMEWRRCLSIMAYSAYCKDGKKGAVVLEHGSGDVNETPPLVFDLLGTARWETLDWIYPRLHVQHAIGELKSLEDVVVQQSLFIFIILPRHRRSRNIFIKPFVYASGVGIPLPNYKNDERGNYPAYDVDSAANGVKPTSIAESPPIMRNLISASTPQRLRKLLLGDRSSRTLSSLRMKWIYCDGPGCKCAERSGYRVVVPVVQTEYKLSKCKCGVKRYCSTDCQLAHWKQGHKRECKALAAQAQTLLAQMITARPAEPPLEVNTAVTITKSSEAPQHNGMAGLVADVGEKPEDHCKVRLDDGQVIAVERESLVAIRLVSQTVPAWRRKQSARELRGESE
mmetsp:Transcript_16776/g.34349  ORF Transcript_16776/g.34349 Transcript_16776/m.34349 type:complete len:381 (-) Transcript_16776:158-1300(-)